MLILCAPPLLGAILYIVLVRIIRSFGAEHLSSIHPKWLTFVFVMNDVLCFCTQVRGTGVRDTGNPQVIDIGKKVVLADMIFSLIVLAFFILIAARFHQQLKKLPTPVVCQNPHMPWQRSVWEIYISCCAWMLRNFVRFYHRRCSRNAG